MVAGIAAAERVIASPLRRTQETAGFLGPPVFLDERWAEIDYGELEGMTLSDVPADVWATWRADPAWAPPGGESLTDVGARVRAACVDLADEASTRDVVVVSHVSPIKAAVAWALGVGDAVVWRMFLDVAGVSRISIGSSGPSLHSYNESYPALSDAV
jgi:broad specificity phosphatase PhoE